MPLCTRDMPDWLALLPDAVPENLAQNGLRALLILLIGLLIARVLSRVAGRIAERRGTEHAQMITRRLGIQLSSEFARLWSVLMGLVGHPWVITCDPTDLIAVPFAWVSWRVLTPAMDPERPAMIGLQRSAVAAASVFGLWATVATSPAPEYDDCPGCGGISTGDSGDTGDWGDTDDEWESVTGHVYIHNPNEFDISITIRTLSPSVTMDCAEIASDPGRLLPDDAFGPAEHWLLPPTTNVAITLPFECGAAKVGGEGIQEQIVFNVDYYFGVGPWGWQTFPGSHDSLDELEERGAAIVWDSAGSSWTGGESWRFTPKTDTVPLPEHCMPEPYEQRIDWSELPGQVIVQVLSKTAGLDGCYEFELAPWLGTGYGPSFAWYLCAPESSVGLEPDSHYQLVSTTMQAYSSVEARLVDPVFFMPMATDNGQLLFSARWVRGVWDTTWIPEVDAIGVPVPTCPWVVAEDCPIVERKLGVRLGGQIEVLPGKTAVYNDADSRHEFTLGHARQLALIDGSCASGSSSLPYDIDYALITEPLVP
jgi:hypothetical protein